MILNFDLAFVLSPPFRIKPFFFLTSGGVKLHQTLSFDKHRKKRKKAEMIIVSQFSEELFV